MVIRLCLLIFLCSCHRKETKLFEAQIFLSIASTFKLKIISPHFINTKKPITKPYFTSQPLVEFDAIGDAGESIKTYCLIFRIPSSRGFGGWVKLMASTCQNKGKDKAMIKGIKNLSVNFNPNTKTFTLIFEKLGDKWQMEFPLLNLTKENIVSHNIKKIRTPQISSVRFSNGINTSLLPGVIFFPLEGENLNGQKIEMMGSPKDNYALGVLNFCHKVDENCQTIQEFLCDRCRYGWYETVPTKCPLTGDKLCGVDRCGEKGQPACFRGYKYLKNISFSGCDPLNKGAFCQDNLELKCDPNGVLICY